MTFRNDETIQCKDCGRPFHWSYRQQREFREKGLEQPKRCPDCIEQHREYLRSSEYDHPVPTILPQDNPFAPHTPSPTPKPITPRPEEKRPSWWENPSTKLTVILWLLVIFTIIILFLIFLTIPHLNLSIVAHILVNFV